MTITIGIDISKLKFDVCVIKDDDTTECHVFANNNNGFKEFHQLLKNWVDVHVGLESTGVYGDNVCQFLYDKKYTVYLLNPAQTKYYAKSMMKRSKTDKCDSISIAQFIKLHKKTLTRWQPRSKNFNILKNMYRCMNHLKRDIRQVQGRIEAVTSSKQPGKSEALKIYTTQKKFLEKQVIDLQKHLKLMIEADEEMNRIYLLLISIPGIGEISAIGLIGSLPDLERFKTIKQLIAYAGLNPGIKESGTSVRGRSSISKSGSKELRSVLYMPALVIKKHSPMVREFAERLKKKGKLPKVVITAVMHKLVRIIYGVLKKGELFRETPLP